VEKGEKALDKKGSVGGKNSDPKELTVKTKDFRE